MIKTHLNVALSLLLVPALALAAPYDSKVRSIDRQVMEMEKRLDSLVRTADDQCDDGNKVCTRTATYRDEKGKIQKTVQEVRSAGGPGTVTGRYYAGCKLILVRVSPNDTEAVKNPRTVERFYFQNDTLLRIVFGEEIQTFSSEQMAYYQRIFRGVSPSCTSLPINK